MKKKIKLLIIGGYGTFGGRLANLLAEEDGLTTLIGGRSLHKAEAFVRQTQGTNCFAVQFDRDANIHSQLDILSPDIVVDASGPFQSYGNRPYRVASAAIDAGIHYIDFADGSEFARGIAELDNDAKAKDVYVLTAVSTCPALTMAAARSLTDRLASVDSIAAGIALSPFAGVGKSVVGAIASYAGRPANLVCDGEAGFKNTFTSTRRFTIAPPGCTPLLPQTFSLIDVPDLTLLASLAVPVANTWFGVSTQPAIYHAFLRLLARAVKLKIISSLQPLTTVMHFVMNHLAWGEHRSGMFLAVRGVDKHGYRVRHSWHLIVEGDNGPTVPTIATAVIVRRHLAGQAPPAGARIATEEVELADYLPDFDALGATYGQRVELTDNRLPVFQQILGDFWPKLPSPIQNLHKSFGDRRFSGTAKIRRGPNPVSKLIGWLAGFPRAGNNVPVTVDIAAREGRETWLRRFGKKQFSSELFVGAGMYDRLICERLGPARIGMALLLDGDKLRYCPRRWSLLGIPMPLQLNPVGEVYETHVGDSFVFHVEIRLPVIGHIVTYHGMLDVSP